MKTSHSIELGGGGGGGGGKTTFYQHHSNRLFNFTGYMYLDTNVPNKFQNDAHFVARKVRYKITFY